MSILLEAAKKLEVVALRAFAMQRAEKALIEAQKAFSETEKEFLSFCEKKELSEFVNNIGIKNAERHLINNEFDTDILEYIEIGRSK